MERRAWGAVRPGGLGTNAAGQILPGRFHDR